MAKQYFGEEVIYLIIFFIFLLEIRLVEKYLTLLEHLGNFCVLKSPSFAKKTRMLQFSQF